MGEPVPLTHQATGRTPRAAVVLAVVWLIIVVLWVALDAATWIAVGFFLTTVPAVWDFVTGRPAALRLDEDGITWRSGRQSGEVARARIARVRFETRMDLSVRVRLVLDSGRRITIPQDALPPWEALRAGFEALGIPTERHHFSLM